MYIDTYSLNAAVWVAGPPAAQADQIVHHHAHGKQTPRWWASRAEKLLREQHAMAKVGPLGDFTGAVIGHGEARVDKPTWICPVSSSKGVCQFVWPRIRPRLRLVFPAHDPKYALVG